VEAFGLATVVFGVSRCFPLTFAALAAAGASDSVSTIIRNTMRQLQTPDRLRARMTSVNQIFFTGGPQLGELEAGLIAQWLGAPFSVVSGGVGCLLAVVWVTGRWPALRRYRGDEPSLAGAPPAATA
jgi:sugar (pentulose or hexulose) kinase